MGRRLISNSRRWRGDRFLAGCLGLVALCVAGCGKGGPATAKVTGRVMLDGKPVEGAAVGFMPEQGGPVASGSTDAEGYFQLSTMNQPGALVGKHQVTVIKTEHSGINPDGTIAPGGVKTKWLIPKKYGNAATSQLTAVVEPGGLDRVFELSSK